MPAVAQQKETVDPQIAQQIRERGKKYDEAFNKNDAPAVAAQWLLLNLENAILINVILAVFNLFPLPPLDGGRIAVGLLPPILGRPLARLEPYGFAILLGLLILLPMLGAQFGFNFSFISQAIRACSQLIIENLLWLTGNVE